MAHEITLIFPHQLFQKHPAIAKGRDVVLIEEWLFFNQYNFHKQKLILHRASMKCYEQALLKQKYTVHYIECHTKENDIRLCIKKLAAEKITTIHIVDVVDNWLMKRLEEACKKHTLKLVVHNTPNFLNTLPEVQDFFDKKKTYFQTDFYTWQRKQRNILVENNGKPVGGKWTYDAENRAKFPKKEIVPGLWLPKPNSYNAEAVAYIEKYYPHNYGSSNAAPLFVIDSKDAEKWLQQFLEQRFEKFGVYEDAIVAQEKVLYHAVLTPMLNIGLLNPQQIISNALQYGQQHNIPLNSVEGFVRQVMGWREFIRIVYERAGSMQRTKNYWQFTRKIPASFWKGTTGIEPIDITIKKILETGYCHHIERLMVLGNFMQLCEFDPNEVYRWFMEMFIDAYDWVMVPNVYGMTQFADGGLMTTKPYISGSNYLMKMSDYPKGEWQQIWDGLFWRFMHVHRSFFLKNPRLGMLVGTFDKMDATKQKQHLQTAETYLKSLDA
jgi:deoxyribodipyrimidine photolyase-related protein